jgi:hypothetical protein
MSINLVALPVRSPLPSDLPGILRDLADRVERGDIKQFVAMFATQDQYEFLCPSSLHDTLILAGLLNHRACAKFGVSQP